MLANAIGVTSCMLPISVMSCVQPTSVVSGVLVIMLCLACLLQLLRHVCQGLNLNKYLDHYNAVVQSYLDLHFITYFTNKSVSLMLGMQRLHCSNILNGISVHCHE